MYIMLEYCDGTQPFLVISPMTSHQPFEGGDFSQYLDKQPNRRLTEERAQYFLRQLGVLFSNIQILFTISSHRPPLPAKQEYSTSRPQAAELAGVGKGQACLSCLRLRNAHFSAASTQR